MESGHDAVAGARTKAQFGAGQLARLQSDYHSARKFYGESLAASRVAGDRRQVALSSEGLGSLWLIFTASSWRRAHSFKRLCQEADFHTARSQYAEALAAARGLGNRIDISISLDGFAAIGAKRGNAEQAVRLASAADGLRESLGYELETAADRIFRNAYVSRLRATLSERAFGSAYEQGRALKMKDAIELALEEAP